MPEITDHNQVLCQKTIRIPPTRAMSVVVRYWPVARLTYTRRRISDSRVLAPRIAFSFPKSHHLGEAARVAQRQAATAVLETQTRTVGCRQDGAKTARSRLAVSQCRRGANDVQVKDECSAQRWALQH